MKKICCQSAVIYARVSSKDQEREGYSIPAQLKFLNEEAAKRGLMVIREFTEAETAKAAGRKVFNEMLAYLKKNPDVRYLLSKRLIDSLETSAISLLSTL